MRIQTLHCHDAAPARLLERKLDEEKGLKKNSVKRMCSLIPTTSRVPSLLTRRLQQHGALRRWQSDVIQGPKRVAAELFKPKVLLFVCFTWLNSTIQAAFALPELMWQRKIEDPERPDLTLLEQATIQPTVLRCILLVKSLN